MTQADPNAPAEKAAAAKRRTAKPKAAAATEVLVSADAEVQQELPQVGPSLSSAETELLAEADKSESSDLSEKANDKAVPASVILEPSADLPEKDEVVPTPESVALEPSVALQEPSDKAESKAFATSKQTQASSPHRIYVTVKNMGMQAVFEPLSKTSIKPGESVEIGCKSNQFKSEVVNNLQQFIGLGKRLEIKNA